MPHQRLLRGKEGKGRRRNTTRMVWRFLWRCISPLPTPREGNTFASRNGLSNRFSHMDQPQFLRHRQEPGSKATKGRTAHPSLPTGKNHGSGETAGTAPESGCHSPLGHGGQGTTPRFTDRCGKKERTRRKQVRLRRSFASGQVFPHGYSTAQEQSPGQKKQDPRPDGRFRKPLNHLAEFIGAFTMDVERQSAFPRHKYLQAIADLENSKRV